LPEIRFGTASFAYEGWKGLVYHERYRAATFKVECLREYARYAPFRIVEFDFPFYRPPSEAQRRLCRCRRAPARSPRRRASPNPRDSEASFCR